MSQLYQRYQSLKNATGLAIKETEEWESLIDAVLMQVILATIKKYQQKVNVGMQDSVSDLLDTFKQKITEAIFETNDAWRAASRSEIDLFPRGCRFCSSRGTSTILVLEQDPQVRSMRFSSGMGGSTAGEWVEGSSNLALSLPYIIFFFHFQNGAFKNLYCGWRTRPLESLNDSLCRPVLPNIHDNLNVCLGRHMSVNQRQSLAQQTNYVLSNFWNSEFNNDLSDHWWSKDRVDARLRTGREWAELSQEDPLFILDVNFRQLRTVKATLEIISNASETPDESQFRHRLSEKIDEHVGILFSKIMRYCKKTKFERHFPKDIKTELGQAFSSSVGDLIDVVYSLNVEIDQLSKEIKEHTPEMEPRSRYWEPYSA